MCHVSRFMNRLYYTHPYAVGGSNWAQTLKKENTRQSIKKPTPAGAVKSENKRANLELHVMYGKFLHIMRLG